MPDTPLLDIPHEEQAQMLAALRRARYGDLLALHILLRCAAGHHPTKSAAVLFCSRSSVYRLVRRYRTSERGCTVDAAGPLAAPVRTTVLLPVVQRSVGALLKTAPRAYGWCRTRWRCATLAVELTAKHGLAVSASGRNTARATLGREFPTCTFSVCAAGSSFRHSSRFRMPPSHPGRSTFPRPVGSQRSSCVISAKPSHIDRGLSARPHTPLIRMVDFAGSPRLRLPHAQAQSPALVSSLRAIAVPRAPSRLQGVTPRSVTCPAT